MPSWIIRVITNYSGLYGSMEKFEPGKTQEYKIFKPTKMAVKKSGNKRRPGQPRKIE